MSAPLTMNGCGPGFQFRSVYAVGFSAPPPDVGTSYNNLKNWVNNTDFSAAPWGGEIFGQFGTSGAPLSGPFPTHPVSTTINAAGSNVPWGSVASVFQYSGFAGTYTQVYYGKSQIFVPIGSFCNPGGMILQSNGTSIDQGCSTVFGPCLIELQMPVITPVAGQLVQLSYMFGVLTTGSAVYTSLPNYSTDLVAFANNNANYFGSVHGTSSLWNTSSCYPSPDDPFTGADP